MKIFFWTKDEHACPQWTRDNANKLWHGLGSYALCITFAFKLGWTWWFCGAIREIRFHSHALPAADLSRP